MKGVLSLLLASLPLLAQAAPSNRAAGSVIPDWNKPVSVIDRVQALRAQSSRLLGHGMKAADQKAAATSSQGSFPYLSNDAPSTGCYPKCDSTLSFANPDTERFKVGNNLPHFGNYSTKTSWAGNVPVGNDPNTTLFFWLWGAETPSNKLVFWFQGGPGCAGENALFQENGPFTYTNVGDKPKTNPYSWTNAANIVYMDQPVGTGFSTGTPTALNEIDVAKQFDGFLTNFFKEFAELQGMEVYIIGESYGGQYAPHVTRYQYQNGNKHNVKGFMVIDGVITARVLQEDAVVEQFVVQHQKQLSFSNSDVQQVKKAAAACGYSTKSFVDRYYKFPPTEKFVTHDCSSIVSNGPFDTYYQLAASRNSCFNVYHVNDVCPTPTNVFGDPNEPAPGSPTYFDATEVKKYIHAGNPSWKLCKSGVFPAGDASPPPDSDGTLVGAIEGSTRSIIVQGNLDGL